MVKITTAYSKAPEISPAAPVDTSCITTGNLWLAIRKANLWKNSVEERGREETNE